LLTTVAGKGQFSGESMNFWSPDYEDGPATNANLSTPHSGMADMFGNIYVADEGSDSVLKVTQDGKIHTIAGTHQRGFNGDGPDRATNLQLNLPNGLWVQADGTIYVL